MRILIPFSSCLHGLQRMMMTTCSDFTRSLAGFYTGISDWGEVFGETMMMMMMMMMMIYFAPNGTVPIGKLKKKQKLKLRLLVLIK